MLNELLTYMDDKTTANFKRSWDFLKIKTAPCEEQYLKLLGKGEEKICAKVHRFKVQQFNNLCVLYALEGRWEHAFRLLYYNYIGLSPNPVECSSPQHYEQFKKERKKLASKDIQIHYDECRGYYRYLCIHELEPYLAKGVTSCFDSWPGVRRLYDYCADPAKPSDDSFAFAGATVLLNLGLYERARKYIDILRGYANMSYRPGRGAYRPQYYHAAIDFLEALYQARTSCDQEESLRYAAKAIAANFRAVVDCFPDEDAASAFSSDDPSLSLCIAVEFEYDTEWAKTCCQAMLSLLESHHFHTVFCKAVKWNAWMWPAEKYGLLSLDKVEEIAFKVPPR